MGMLFVPNHLNSLAALQTMVLLGCQLLIALHMKDLRLAQSLLQINEKEKT